MSDLFNTIKEIEKGKNLEMNLPKYMNFMMSAYHRYSSIRLAFNYYTYFEMKQEEKEFSSELQELTNRLDQVLTKTVLSEFDGSTLEKAVKEIDQIRNEIIIETKTLTLYADQFQLYEYMLNRIEGNFEEVEALPLNYSDEKFVQKLADYVMQDSDRAAISSKITEIVSNLPMRLTKQRFYEIVKDSFLLFEGSERQALEDHIFLLKSSAALIEPEDGAMHYPKLASKLDLLKQADFDALTPEIYFDLKQKLEEVTDFIERMTSLFMMLIEVVNDAYIFLLSMPYALTDVEETTICKEIIRRVSDSRKEEEAAFENLFSQLEGKQEKVLDQLSANAYLIDSLSERQEFMKGIMLDKIYSSLLRIEKLASTSHFIELDAKEDKREADRAYVEQRANEVNREFAKAFQGRSRREIRSMMAASMIALPVFFKNMDELKEYAKISLMGCSDKEEKRSSVILLKTIMESLSE